MAEEDAKKDAKEAKDAAKPKGQVAMAKEPYAVFLLLLGFFFFGAAIGGVTGVSSHAGISNTLLTSLCTFVGGSLLGFGGFVRGVKGDVAYVSGRRLGAGLMAFSLGVGVGLFGGVCIRLEYGPRIVNEKGEVVQDQLLHGENQTACEAIADKIATRAYDDERALPELRRDLERLARLSCTGAGRDK